MTAWKAWASMGLCGPQGAFRLHGAAELCDSQHKDLCCLSHPGPGGPLWPGLLPSVHGAGGGGPIGAPSHLPEAPVRRLTSTSLHHHWAHRDGRLGEKKS